MRIIELGDEPDEYIYPTPNIRIKDSGEEEMGGSLLIEVRVQSLPSVLKKHPTLGDWWNVAAPKDTWVPLLDIPKSTVGLAISELAKAHWNRERP